jgi:hypothetical protein
MSDLNYVRLSREADDFVELDGKQVRVIRASCGGLSNEARYYCKFRGEPAEIIELLEQCLWAMKAKFGKIDTAPGEGKTQA